MKWDLHGDSVVIRHVVDDELDWVQNHHQTRSGIFQVVPDDRLELLDFSSGGDVGNAQFRHECKQCTGRDTSSTKRNDGIQAGVIPVLDETFLDQASDFAFREESALKVESGELVLPWFVDGESIAKPFVRFTCGDEFDCTERMANG